ncbi:MAG: ATP-binding cassette domain-containing protein [Herminiimonas sp.]|nr:ATP-binding cassette domain-containing protein [Herminiimonas sp.]
MTLSLTSLSVRHPGADQPALQQLTVTIGSGEQVALIGPSGAGKTTLLHTLALAQRPSGGQLTAFGGDPWAISSTERHALRAQLFLAPQTPPLPPRQRVVTAVLAGRLPRWSVWRAIASLVRPNEPQAAFDALARFNLQHKLYARVDRLSGGERQRCGMARLLVSDARLLLVDEPLSALDPTLAVQTIDVLQDEARQRNAILICSLHQVALARAHFPRIIGLRDGRIVFDARREDVTDAMIEALYRNTAAPTAPRPWVEGHAAPSGAPAPVVVLVPRC